MLLDEHEQEIIASAIAEAEKSSAGEIVCVLARQSSQYGEIPLTFASFVAFAAPWPLIAFTDLSVQWIFLIQLLVFFALALLMLWQPLRMAIIPRSIKRARAHRAATEQFFTRGIGRTRGGSGVLIYASLAEHYARIVVDDGIARKIDSREWKRCIDILIGHLRDGRIAQGYAETIAECGKLLAQHVPPKDTDNELPDRIYLI